MKIEINSRRVVRFIPVVDGDIVDLPHVAVPGIGRRGYPTTGTYAIGAPESGVTLPSRTAGTSGDHILIGYQPAPLNPRARKPYEPSGWLIVLVNEEVRSQPAKLRRNARAVA